MDVSKYITELVDPQIKWHDSKSCLNKWGYIICSIISIAGSIISAAVIQYSSLCGTILSAIVAIAVGINSLFKFQTKWKLYRSTAESLRIEKIHYNVGGGPYTGSDKEKAFVDSVMKILKATNADWQLMFNEDQPTSVEVN